MPDMEPSGKCVYWYVAYQWLQIRYYSFQTHTSWPFDKNVRILLIMVNNPVVKGKFVGKVVRFW